MNLSSLATLLVGFVFGLKHATEADHIAAVSTLVTEEHGARRGAFVGAFWGLGHLLTLFVFGGALILLRLRMSPRLEWALELLVAFVLVGLGARTLARSLQGRYHFHIHQHGVRVHSHVHFHSVEELTHEHSGVARELHHHGVPLRPAHRVRPLLVGMAHGLAGTAALTLLVLTTISSRSMGMIYLLLFGAGALTGMAAFGALLGAPFGRAASRLGWLQALRLAAGAASCSLGVFLAVRAFLPAAFPF